MGVGSKKIFEPAPRYVYLRVVTTTSPQSPIADSNNFQIASF